jgi:hypothetical protein
MYPTKIIVEIVIFALEPYINPLFLIKNFVAWCAFHMPDCSQYARTNGDRRSGLQLLVMVARGGGGGGSSSTLPVPVHVWGKALRLAVNTQPCELNGGHDRTP